VEEEQNLDLDDLFRDCYFGDFPVPDQNTSSVPAPLVPNSQFYSSQQPLAAVEVEPAAVGDKRKAELSLEEVTSLNDASLKKDGASTKPLTDQQKVERRERNRKHAKRSRLRKKFLLESLQEQINGLQSEIDSLQAIIKRECPDKAEKLLESVSGPKGKFTPLPMPSGFGPVKTLMEPDFRLMSALSGSQQNFAISDPSLPDNPIVYVSQGFLQLTGYTLDQVLGRNCRFLQGPGTDQSAVDVIRKGVREGVDTSVCLLNYKADGTPFWNQFFVAALRDAENNVVNFVGVQCEVSKATVEKQMAEKREKEKSEQDTQDVAK
jgi:PAS domain S-box-containing protein